MFDNITYFTLNQNSLTDGDYYILKALYYQNYFQDFISSFNNALDSKSKSKEYFFKFIPLDVAINPKVYDQNDIFDLNFLSQSIKNPYIYNWSKQIHINQRILLIDETDREFIILCKAKEYYQRIFDGLQKALEYRGSGRQYFFSFNSPDWFPETHKYSIQMQGERLIQLWKHKELGKF